MKALEEAKDELWQAAQAIEADLGGNADSRIRQTSGGGFIMIEEARVRWLLNAIRGVRSARVMADNFGRIS